MKSFFKRGSIVLCGLFFSSCSAVPPSEPRRVPEAGLDAAFLARTVQDRAAMAMDARIRVGLGWGYVAAIREDGKSTTLARGKKSLEPVREIGTSELFEIGSVSKLFTGLMVSIAEQNGQMKASERLDRFFPEFAGKPVGAITISELGLHQSGLPSSPSKGSTHDPVNPWEGWTAAEVLTPLATVELSPVLEGKSHRPRVYSNWGYLLLGLVLEKATGKPYAKLLDAEILRPLGMRKTGVDRLEKRRRGKRLTALVPSYTLAGDPAAPWIFSGFTAAAGGIESTAGDMALFLETFESAAVGDAKASPARRRVLEAMRSSLATGIGWDSEPGQGMQWKNGGTAAFSSVFAWDPAKKRGAFFAGNSPVSVDDFAWIALGYSATDTVLAPIAAAPSPSEEDSVGVRGKYRVVSSDPAQRDEFPLKEIEVLESFGRLRARLDFGKFGRDGGLLLATRDSDEWKIFAPDGTTHDFERRGKGADFAIDLGGRKVTFELEKSERVLESYPAWE